MGEGLFFHVCEGQREDYSRHIQDAAELGFAMGTMALDTFDFRLRMTIYGVSSCFVMIGARDGTDLRRS